MELLAESITEAAQTADLLTSAIGNAHNIACTKYPITQMILLELEGDAVKLQKKLEQLQSAALSHE